VTHSHPWGTSSRSTANTPPTWAGARRSSTTQKPESTTVPPTQEPTAAQKSNPQSSEEESRTLCHPDRSRGTLSSHSPPSLNFVRVVNEQRVDPRSEAQKKKEPANDSNPIRTMST